MKIIADVGSNWYNLDDCLESITKLASLDVDIVKFQYFTFKKLYGVYDVKNEYTHMHFMPKAWIEKLCDYCENMGIEFMCTVFDEKDIPFIWDYVWRFKVASAEISHLPMLYALKKYEGEADILISTGCATEHDLERCHKMFGDDVCFMACDATYPSTEPPLQNLRYLQDNYANIGYSDHSIDRDLGIILADSFGCQYYERHFTLSRVKGTPDSKHSLDEWEWQLMLENYAHKRKTDDYQSKWIDQTRPFKRVKTDKGFYRPLPV